MDRGRVQLGDDELRARLRSCLAVSRWVEEVAAQGPYSSLPHLLDVAAAAGQPSSPEEIDEAMTAHPRIGDRPAGQSPEHRFSRAEQEASSSGDAAQAEQLARGNAAYEERFGRVFLIRAAGRSRSEVLAELRRRLRLDDETERGIVAAELREIALLRIPQVFSELDADRTGAG